MRAAADGSEAPRAAWSPMPGRNMVVSRDGRRVAYLVGGGNGGGRGAGRGGRGRADAPVAEAAPPPSVPTEIRVRSLDDDSDRTVATFEGPVTTLAWAADDNHLTFTTGGAETIRHEQTPEYSGARIIYTITERVAGAPPDAYLVALSGGAPAKFSGGCRRRIRRPRTNRWVDSSHFLVNRQSADFKRAQHLRWRHYVSASPSSCTRTSRTTFWSMTGDAGGGLAAVARRQMDFVPQRS